MASVKEKRKAGNGGGDAVNRDCDFRQGGHEGFL